jgi:hypothetical protein
LFERIKVKEVLTCQELQEELNKFSDLDRLEWPSCTSPLRACIEADNVQLIQTCLDDGIRINSTDDFQTVLYWSIKWNKVKSMTCLLDQGAEVTIPDLALAFEESDDTVFLEFYATLKAKHGLNNHGLDSQDILEQLIQCQGAVTNILSLEDFEKTLLLSLSVGEAALHVGFKISDGSGGQIDSVHKAVKWVLSKGHNDSDTLHQRLCAIAIKENCKDSQDLLLKGGLDIEGEKASTLEDFYIFCIKSMQVR